MASAAGDRAAVVLGLEPAYPSAHLLGPAMTVQGAGRDNLALHHAIAAAEAGEVIVLAVGGEEEIAHCGEILAVAARRQGVAGIVLDGAIRDRVEIERLAYPVFHRGTSPRGPGKDGPGALRVTIDLFGVSVSPGDLVCADADGVVFVPAGEAETVLVAAAELEAREREIVAEVERGSSTVEIFGLEELA
jgi:4-hydroxy-4-methyl-2-oxoglutarate aldolase